MRTYVTHYFNFWIHRNLPARLTDRAGRCDRYCSWRSQIKNTASDCRMTPCLTKQSVVSTATIRSEKEALLKVSLRWSSPAPPCWSFCLFYYVIDERIQVCPSIGRKYQDIILLLFLCFSVILNGWLDIVFVPLEEIDSNQKASIRLVSSFYIILILLYIKFIINDDNYDSLMMYFITLAVGRFIYFDFTMDDFLSTLHGFWEELPLLILMASYSGFVCWFWILYRIPAYV